MQLDGIHHVTCITADAAGNVDFYARVLGLRLVKKTVNFDAPDVYHLYYGDERGAPGSLLTFFEFPDAAPGRVGAGMIHRLRWRVGSEEALGFWAERLAREGVLFEMGGSDQQSLAFRDPEGLGLELDVAESGDEPLRAEADGIAPDHALLGFDGVRAYSPSPTEEERLLTEGLGFTMTAPGRYVLEGGRRRASYAHDEPPPAVGIQGAGTVHHIAWCDRDDEHEDWRQHLMQIGARPTPIIDRQYFLSIYFREPRGVLFELATPSPGFAIDEDPEHLGEALRLPPQHEHLREHLERSLTPLQNPSERGPLVSGEIDLLAYELRPARGEPTGALVLLHGRGADQFDLLPLLDELDPDRRMAGVTPRAPLELSPGGFHWYISRAVGHPDADTFHATYATLARWLDAMPGTLGVPWSRTVLGGFSIGAVMSYALGLGGGRPAPAGILALSGFIPTVERFELDLSSREGFPVAIGHGTQDPVIPVDFACEARRRLEAAGMRVLYRESRMFHGIDPLFVHVLQNWMADIVGLAPAAKQRP